MTTSLSRREALRLGIAGTAALVGGPLLRGATSADEPAGRPNILWITCEDLSPDLGCYGDTYARTPHLDAFAARSLRYENAFASAPVCSPARTALLFGRHPCGLGANNHRSRPPTDPDIRGYPAHLRDAGYWTSNHDKTDYNTDRLEEVIADCWDSGGTWRDRPAGAGPFMSVVNLRQSHASRGMVWPFRRFEREIQAQLTPEEVHDPAAAPLPPWLPDTPLMRRGVARYYDCATVMDKHVGKLLAQLEDDRLAENTIVFFYSDHGTGLPRYKQTSLDSGLRVPLLIHVPPRWRHVAPAEAGAVTDRLVDFVDLGPTVLRLAGVAVPASMRGRPFLNVLDEEVAPPREVVFGARDRLDEAYDVQRTVRDGRYRYLRNFMPHVPHLQQNDYWRTAEMAQALFHGLREGTLPEETARLFQPKAPEELYDLEADPWEVHNLAGDPAHAQRLETMRARLGVEMRRIGDLNIVQEGELTRRADGRPLTAIPREELPLDRTFDAAEQVGLAPGDRLVAALDDEEPMVRWWTVIALRQETGKDATQALRACLDDAHPLVAGEAALALVARDAEDADEALVAALASAPEAFAEYLARMSIYSGDRATITPLLRRALDARPDFAPLTRAIDALKQLYA